MTNSNPYNTQSTHTAPTDTDLTNNSSPISAPVHSRAADDNSSGNTPANSASITADPMAQPMPPAQDAGQIPSTLPDLHTGLPTIDLPLTSSTGTGFNAPDAGTGVPDNSGALNPDNSGMGQTTADNAPLPGVGNIDRDALAGQNKGAGSQVDAEAVSSTGPV